jgi:hypothetical protein
LFWLSDLDFGTPLPGNHYWSVHNCWCHDVKISHFLKPLANRIFQVKLNWAHPGTAPERHWIGARLCPAQCGISRSTGRRPPAYSSRPVLRDCCGWSRSCGTQPRSGGSVRMRPLNWAHLGTPLPWRRASGLLPQSGTVASRPAEKAWTADWRGRVRASQKVRALVPGGSNPAPVGPGWWFQVMVTLV